MKKRRMDLTRITVSPGNSRGELLGGVIVCRDITQIKEEEFFRAGQSGCWK